ncbi:MAG TPA: TIGR00730 family Rossman fold protein [Parapedobacter sp.]|nr:TIGR00730 family Rossman fold protein [Parapedobacter sp.]
MNNIVVFCGSSAGTDHIYEEQAFQLGRSLAEAGIGLVYGGAKVGLMGAVADGALQHGGKVTGVLPYFLRTKEIAHEGLTELFIVDTMHERKTKMNQLCDGIIALPGGFGTMEEFFEMLTWGQLGLHQKPMGLLNTEGFYDGLLALAQHMVNKGFLKTANQQMLLSSTAIPDLLHQMQNYQPPAVGKWITQETT